ncbi:hypothetical protein SISNIDRAFT_277209 [Sistotremastrum niveocremeum HHB9708]|uniref:DUF7918 domain-containing protein n=1 Tax=Sistotremastrum niveocremeum HHB9708 TaxID=1314777 RepID=A0A164NU55_9AGAM|nr:hypothetical protein SISNIDRAFT_277209 [Sistotremastrum niveocremeum HHB9708]
MPRIEDFEVKVIVEDQRLEEYKLQEVPRSNVAGQPPQIQKTCFIASTAGKSFKVVVRDLRELRDPEVSVKLYLDGVQVRYNLTEVEELSLDYCRVERTKGAPFVFAPIKLTEHFAEAERDEGTLKNLGTIKTEIEFVKRTGEPAGLWAHPTHKKDVTVHEMAKKGGGHFSRLGDAISVPSPIPIKIVALEHLPKLVCTFSYAPEEWLRAKEIIKAPSSSPESTPEPRNVLKRKNQNIDEATAPKKSKTTAGPSRPKPAVKLEEHDDDFLDPDEARLFQKLRNKIKEKKQAQGIVKLEPFIPEPGLLRPGEVIDLTDD